MKKFYLSICAIVITFTSFAQKNNVRTVEYSDNTSKFHCYTSSDNTSKAPPFWSDDFSNAANWVIDHDPTACFLDWQIGVNSCTGSYPIDDILSTSASNGWAMIDSDSYGGATGGTEVEDCWLTMANPVDLNGYQYVTLEFETQYRSYNSEQCYIVVGIGDGAGNVTWPDLDPTTDISTMTNVFKLFPGFASSDATTNPQTIAVNIGSALVGLTSTELADIYIRFHWTGTWGYAWFVDDVSLSETPDNAASISDAVQGGWWVNYLNVAGGTLAGFDFTFQTPSQLAMNPYSFEAVLHNDGVGPQNMVLNAEVFNDQGASVFTSTSNSELLSLFTNPPLLVDTFACNNTFAPTTNGVYEMKLWGTGDSIVTDVAVLYSVVSDYIYGRDWDQANGSRGVSRPCGGQVVGTTLDIYANETVYGIQVHIDAESVVGAQVFVSLYENDAAGGDPIWLAQSDDYTLTPNDLDNWITVPLGDGEDLFAGTSYLAAVGGYPNPVDTFQVNLSGNSQGATCFIQDNGCNIGSGAFGDWYWLSNIPMIRMSFDPAALSVDNVMSGEFNVYPNPNNGVFTIELNNIKADDYKISVTNVLGQEVYTSTKEISTLISEKIDLSDFEKGVYILEISNSNSTISEKIIVE